MKYSWMLLSCLFLCGCEEAKQRRADIEKTTITKSFYLTTVLHDEHLFIIHNFGGDMMHHPNCPCHKDKETKQAELTPPSPIIIDFKSLK